MMCEIFFVILQHITQLKQTQKRMENTCTCRLSTIATTIVVAALLWFFMFSPWTKELSNFWITMTGAGLCLTALALILQRDSLRTIAKDFDWRQIVLGLALAAVLWGVFWVGDKLSSMMFGFARGQVDNIYGMKVGLPSWLIAILLLLIIGPAEEIFWRGFVQRQLSERWGANCGFIVATLIYTLIHIWSFNFMLVMAAMVCGVIWGGLYRLKPKWLPALIISHAIWDACVFVVFPI